MEKVKVVNRSMVLVRTHVAKMIRNLQVTYEKNSDPKMKKTDHHKISPK